MCFFSSLQGLIQAVLDSLYSLIFLCGIAYFYRYIYREAFEYHRDDITIINYTVEVRGLPFDYTDRDGLKQFFEKRVGQVEEVAIIYNDYNVSKPCTRIKH